MIGLYRVYAVPAVPDVALYVWLAGRVLDGAHLYRDILELNPPLIVWLNIPGVWLARLFGLSPLLTFHTIVLALIAASVAVSVRVLVFAFPDATQSTQQRWVALLAFVLLVLPGLDFGQREHIMLVLVLPYLAITVSRLVGRAPGATRCVAIGAAAGAGIALKPFFAVLWVALEVLLWFGPSRLAIWRRIESVTAITVIAGYSVVVALVYPAYFQLLRDYGALYHTYLTQPATSLLRTQGTLWTACAMGLLALVRPHHRHTPIARVLALSSVALAAAAFLQQKGWAYHFYPAFALSTLLILLLMQDTSPKSPMARLRRAHALTTGLLLATAMTVVRDVTTEFAVATGREDEARDALALAPVVHSFGTGTRVMIFSPTHSIAFPLVLQADVQWASRYISMWPMSAFHDARVAGDARFAGLERRFIRDIVDDLTKDPPLLIIVDVAPVPASEYHGFAGLRYFAKDQRFASLITEYDRIGDVRRYRIFRRARLTPVVTRSP